MLIGSVNKGLYNTYHIFTYNRLHVSILALTLYAH